MLKSILTIIVVIGLITGCRKNFEYARGPIDNNIVGKWEFSEYFMSPGDAGKWYKAKPGGRVIHFKADGSFSATREGFKQFTKYELLNTGKIRLSAVDSGNTMLLGFSIDTDNAWLFTYPGEAICVEGCSDKYRLVK